MKRFFIFGILTMVLVIIVSCKSQETPLFQETECMFTDFLGRETQCGTLIVPEDRTQADSPMIELQVAIISSTHSNPEPDPIVILQGGPGASAIESIESWAFMFRNTINRDLIVLDQRGTGYSQPALNCPELEEPYYELYELNLSSVEESQRLVQMLQECHDRLVAEGVNPAAYTSAASAADVADLRRAMGYKEWNIYGSSYGTRLALTVMRDHPDGIRSVILDSPYPPQADLYVTQAVNGERSLELIFNNCAAEEACSQAYPDLKNKFIEMVDQLNKQPVSLAISRPQTGKSYNFVLNGDRLIKIFFDLMYRTQNLPRLPKLIYDLASGDWDALPGLIRASLFWNDAWFEGMYYAVQCSEEAYFGSPEVVQLANAAVSLHFGEGLDNASIYELCGVWKTQSPPAFENEPVVSSIPTLILTGEYDPITPPAWGELASETLPESQFFVFPGVGHGVLVEESICPYLITSSFLDDPNSPVNAACLDRLGLTFAIK